MKHKAIKVGITGLVLALSFAGLLYSTMAESTEYYKHVDEVMVAPQTWYGKSLQLHGYVVPNSILRKRNSMEYRFKVQSQGQVVDASYNGIVPDTFQDDAEVVLKGVLSKDGFAVHPNGVMAKCPSKYEAKVDTSGAASAPRTGTE
ncbi:MAG: cytochrome c maturation protein CcmE [Vicinamibacterales bacterium]